MIKQFNKEQQEGLSLMNKLAAKIISDDYKIIDNHTGETFNYDPIGLAMKANGEVGLLINANIYCLNAVYEGADNKVHLSKRSIGGTIRGALNVSKYNENCISEDGHIIKIIYFKDIHMGKFESIEEFDRFFYNENSILMI